MPRRFYQEHFVPHAPDIDTVRCSACGFRVEIDAPEAQSWPIRYARSGTVYTVAPGASVTGIDKKTVPVVVGGCPFCGTNRPFDGKRGCL